jgi:hypothetical protein
MMWDAREKTKMEKKLQSLYFAVSTPSLGRFSIVVFTRSFKVWEEGSADWNKKDEE